MTCDRVRREGGEAVAGAADGAGHRGDRVAVAAQRRGQQAGPPRVVGHGAEHRERGGHRLLGGQAGADERVDHLGGLRGRRPATRPAAHSMRAATSAPATQWPRWRRAGRRPPPRRSPPRRVGRACAPSTPALHRGGHGGGAGQRHRRVVRDEARLCTASTRAARSSAGDRDADRGDPHRRAVGVARGARLLRRGAREHRLDRAAGGRAEQVERPAGGHVAFPGDQARPRARAGSTRPDSSRRPSRTACSVSSVTAPAGMPAAIGCPGGAGSKPVSSGPQRSATCGRDSSWVGMPSASPIARPYSAPLARSRCACVEDNPLGIHGCPIEAVVGRALAVVNASLCR